MGFKYLFVLYRTKGCFIHQVNYTTHLVGAKAPDKPVNLQCSDMESLFDHGLFRIPDKQLFGQVSTIRGLTRRPL